MNEHSKTVFNMPDLDSYVTTAGVWGWLQHDFFSANEYRTHCSGRLVCNVLWIVFSTVAKKPVLLLFINSAVHSLRIQVAHLTVEYMLQWVGSVKGQEHKDLMIEISTSFNTGDLCGTDTRTGRTAFYGTGSIWSKPTELVWKAFQSETCSRKGDTCWAWINCQFGETAGSCHWGGSLSAVSRQVFFQHSKFRWQQKPQSKTKKRFTQKLRL